MGVYIAGFSGYKEGKLFTAATKRRQAKIVWDEMRKFIQSDEDLQELRHWLARFFAMRADRELERLWNEGVITEQTIEDWGKEHMRTPYRSNNFSPA